MAQGRTHRLVVGDEAPDFELKCTRAEGGEQKKCRFRLSQHRGRPVALAFTMAAFTPV